MANLVKALLKDAQALVSIINSTEIINEAIKLHNLSPVAAAAFGRTLSMGSILGTTLGNDTDKLTIQIKGNGELNGITVCSDSKGNVKGYVGNPNVESFINSQGKLDVATAVGKEGKLTVIKNMGLKEPYIGTSKLISGEIAEDFAEYFAISEQQPCAVLLGVLVNKDGNCSCSGGIFIQILPFCEESVIDEIEKLIPQIGNVSQLMSKMSIAEILETYFKKLDYEITEEIDTKYLCDCNRTRLDSVIVALGKKETAEILLEEKQIELVCNFCNKKYQYNKDDVDALLGE